jgi:hypothetical protein
VKTADIKTLRMEKDFTPVQAVATKVSNLLLDELNRINTRNTDFYYDRSEYKRRVKEIIVRHLTKLKQKHNLNFQIPKEV